MAAFMFRRQIISKFTSQTLNPLRNYGKKIKLELREKKSVAPVSKDFVSYDQSRNQIDAFKTSLQSRGFLRKQKAFVPPPDVVDRIKKISETVYPKNFTWKDKLEDVGNKYKFLSLCWKEFDHQVPNSMLAPMDTIQDICDYYQTEVKTTTPLDALKEMDLPQNLTVQYEYHRFHPETDTMFGGVSAFPGSSTIVTGLKYKKKYKGYIAPKD
ncbi:uncharacterized protein LOC132201566 [Neocloeon triangulifer]|uniref:uncharacterized protein LOC132201566 n=1 Tax=Neocloeon triangulifer TaxID=2078957 RepID=UPI00286EC0C6|nr:uncharacterized protein LOC132201566 [Neocloeon triangulifer]